MKTILTVMNTSWVVAKKGPKKNLGLYGIWTNDLCDNKLWIFENHVWTADKDQLPEKPDERFNR